MSFPTVRGTLATHQASSALRPSVSGHGSMTGSIRLPSCAYLTGQRRTRADAPPHSPQYREYRINQGVLVRGSKEGNKRVLPLR